MSRATELAERVNTAIGQLGRDDPAKFLQWEGVWRTYYAGFDLTEFALNLLAALRSAGAVGEGSPRTVWELHWALKNLLELAEILMAETERKPAVDGAVSRAKTALQAYEADATAALRRDIPVPPPTQSEVAAPDAWKLVPLAMTGEMFDAMYAVIARHDPSDQNASTSGTTNEAWNAALSAAPPSPDASPAQVGETQVERAKRQIAAGDFEEVDPMTADAPTPPPADPVTVEMAARAFVDKLNAIHNDPAYKSVWEINQLHAGAYSGPNYSAELAALERSLSHPSGEATALARPEGAQATDAGVVEALLQMFKDMQASTSWDPATTRRVIEITENAARASPTSLDPATLEAAAKVGIASGLKTAQRLYDQRGINCDAIVTAACQDAIFAYQAALAHTEKK